MLKLDYVSKWRNSQICRKHKSCAILGVISAEIVWIRKKKLNALKMVADRSLNVISCKNTNGR
jgi:hypothetical protein